MKSILARLNRVADFLETISEHSGRAAAWLCLILVMLVAYDVSMRYLFRAGSVALQELEWHLFALIFLFGAAYTLKHDAHARLEIFYQRFSNRTRAWVDLLGSLLFLLPLCLVILKGSWPFVHNAFVFGEGSPDPGGLPYRFLIKAAIPVGFALLSIQAVAFVFKNLRLLIGHDSRQT
jgi:TRAP-type mannitol/chloroaromatic compound transport system permease small subunit